jgi:hypothetical protein
MPFAFLVALGLAVVLLVVLGIAAFILVARSQRSTGSFRGDAGRAGRDPRSALQRSDDSILMMPLATSGSPSNGRGSSDSHSHHHHGHQHTSSHDIPASVPADPSSCGDAGWDSPCSADSGGGDSGGGGDGGGGGGGDGGGGD